MSAPPSYSKLPAPQYMQSPRVCCITLNEGDKLRLIGVPNELVPHLRAGIIRTWGKIKREQNYSGAHEFKMSGNPCILGADLMQVDMFCVSFGSSDKLRIIDAPSPDVVAVVRQAIMTQWKSG
ncbi:hypothetical protein BGZ97_010146, partial [Linnemannia gamsii]